jgi:hypothetical protein
MFAAALAGAFAVITTRTSKADGILTVSNRGQIVSTGDVNVSQGASGVQTIYDERGVAIGAVSNDLQIVSTGNVNASQAASGNQTVYGRGDQGGGSCTPGEYRQQDGCLIFCTDDCEWAQFCCDKAKKEKCCK